VTDQTETQPHLPYRPNGLQMWDAWYANRGDETHAIYLQMPTAEGIRPAEEANFLGHAVSKNLVDWTELAPSLGPNTPGSADDLPPWTGCLFEHDGRYYLYYTMRRARPVPGRVQSIGLAISDDLETWERYDGNPVITPDPRWYHTEDDDEPSRVVVDARDLIIQPNPAGTGWYGFYAARTRAEGLAESAAIATVFSEDLIHWEHLAPAFTPGTYACIEVPDVFPLNGRWYMTCLARNRYGNRSPFSDPLCTAGTIYAVADEITGPYRELPGDNVLIGGDTTSGYSCRSVERDDARFVLYTEPTQTGEDSLSPPFEVVAQPDGGLRLRHNRKFELLRDAQLIAAPRLELTPVANSPYWPNQSGAWSAVDGGADGTAEHGWQTVGVGAAGADGEVVADFTAENDGLVGFVLYPQEAPADAYGGFFCGIDRRAGTCEAGEIPDFTMLHRRTWPVGGRTVSLRLVLRHPRFELFVDDELVLQFAHPLALSERSSLGLLVENGSVSVRNLSAWSLRRS
jgi:hypothetical protein